ncbi:VQ protein [Dillenia turbinata]|uniref:VQ protein n=1 Tax=Dillenia turbinata TaxID=194707 RepID=A0AAN8VNH3_9MAGN
MDNSKNRHNEHLGVNKLGKNIRKSPLHQPNFANNNNTRPQPPQPQVYNISKNDFRNIVQQLTGSPSRGEPLPRPPHRPPKSPNMRLQRIRPPPLNPPINRPHMPAPAPAPALVPAPVPIPGPVPVPGGPVAIQGPPHPYDGGFVRPAQFGQPSPTPLPPLTPGDAVWANTAESPISAYMRYLQNSFIEPGPRPTHPQPWTQPPQVPAQVPAHPPSSGLLPNPPVPPFPSPRLNGPAVLPSPTSQYLLPSPSAYLNLVSPRSPYPLLSPGYQFPPPLTPNFSFSPSAQSGILGPGPQPPPSSGFFPLSPSGFFPVSSPRWREP